MALRLLLGPDVYRALVNIKVADSDCIAVFVSLKQFFRLQSLVSVQVKFVFCKVPVLAY